MLESATELCYIVRSIDASNLRAARSRHRTRFERIIMTHLIYVLAHGTRTCPVHNGEFVTCISLRQVCELTL